MKVKDIMGIKGEAMRLMFNRENQIYFDQNAYIELEKPSNLKEWISNHPEAHFYEFNVRTYMTSLIYVAGQLNYLPKDSKKYYESISLARQVDVFNDACLLFLLGSPDADKPAVLKLFQKIVETADGLLKKYKNGRYLGGDQYTLADFVFVGLFFPLTDQPKLISEVMSTIHKFPDISNYLDFHRDEFLPYLIKGGRYTTCYAVSPYTDLYQMMMSTKRIRIRIEESKEQKFVIAGITYPCFLSALEMLARTIGLLENDHIFENVQYRDVASSVILSTAPKTFEAQKNALLLLENYYGFLRSTSKNQKWNLTLADVYSAVAAELCCADPASKELFKVNCPEYYAFYFDFTCRYKRAEHCIILKGDLDKEFPYPSDVVTLVNFMKYCRLDLHDVMKNLGFRSAETQYPLLKGHEETFKAIKERKDFKEGKAEIFAYLDANEKTDFMLGPSGLKCMEDLGMQYAGSSYDFCNDTVCKARMKKQLSEAGVPTAPYVYLEKWDEEAVLKSNLTFPVIVKLTDAYASYGLTKDSKCKDLAAMKKSVIDKFTNLFNHPVIVENFITGREFTVLVVGNYNQEVFAYPPTERVFDDSLPDEDKWLFYELYWKSATQKLFFKRLREEKLAQDVAELAKKAYVAMKGSGYSRIDIREEKKSGDLHVLEVNSIGCVGFESTSFYVLKEGGFYTEDLMEDIFYYGKKKYLK